MAEAGAKTVGTGIALAAALALLGASGQARAQELWRGLTLGMSRAEVARMFPRATAPQDRALADDQTDVLEAAGQQLEGRPATARFTFRQDGLVSVQLNSDAVRPAHSRENVAFAKAAAEGLTARYGTKAAYDCGDRTYADVASYECGWLTGPLTVKLAYLDVAGQAPQLSVTWRRAGDPNYDL